MTALRVPCIWGDEMVTVTPGRPVPSVANPHVSDRSCSIFCSAIAVVDVLPRATRFARPDIANNCATPSEIAVHSPRKSSSLVMPRLCPSFLPAT